MGHSAQTRLGADPHWPETVTQEIHLRLGDCAVVMAQMEQGSIANLICDPPYGLEFMGKDWDKLEPNRKTQRWKDTERKNLIGDGSGKGGGFGARMGELPAYIPKRNQKCRTCGHYRFSGHPCQCDDPDWDNRGNEFNIAMQEWHQEWLAEAYRVLAVGGVAKVFSGTRTFHRLAPAMVAAGFQDLHMDAWIYGSGFPKSHDVSKAIDKHLGVEREVVGTAKGRSGPSVQPHGASVFNDDGYQWKEEYPVTVAATDEARAWQGWGTALKPAWEPVLIGVKRTEKEQSGG